MWQRWCDLPSDLLYEIDAELTYIEKVRVRATCLWWNSALPKMPNHKLPQLPWLLHTNVDRDGTNSHSLFNLGEENSYRVDLPQLQGKLLKGSSNGWLVTISVNKDDGSPDICLLNPLNGVQIRLPPRSTFPDVIKYYPDKVGEEYHIKTCDIDDIDDYGSSHVHHCLTKEIVISSDFVAVAIYGELRKLAWCMPGHDKWTPLDFYVNTGLKHYPIEKVLFSDKKLYVINYRGQLFEVKDIGPSFGVSHIITKKLLRSNCCDRMSLVERSDGSIMMVIALDNDLFFEAYDIDLPNKCWRLVRNIGNDMIFLGGNHGFSMSSCQFPGFRGNRIYFSNDHLLFVYCKHMQGDDKIGIFNIADRTVEKLPGCPSVRRFIWTRRIWVTPPSYSNGATME